jgi:hypothetical protein
VAERLAVARHRHQVAARAPQDAVDDHLGQEAPERHLVGDGPVVDHQVDRQIGIVRVAPAQRAGQVHRGVGAGHGVPLGRPRRSHGGDLVGRQDGEADALLGQRGQDPIVDRGLGQPQALGRPAEAVAEVGQAPADLRAQVPVVAQREDGVAVRLGDGPARGPVGLDDAGVGVRGVVLQPRQQRGAHVERQPQVVVHDGDDAAVVVQDAGPAVGPVALGRDALVPIVEGRGRRLAGHHLGPGVLPRGLVEVAVEDEGDVCDQTTLEAERMGREPQPESPRFGGRAAARQRGLPATQHRNTRPCDLSAHAFSRGDRRAGAGVRAADPVP